MNTMNTLKKINTNCSNCVKLASAFCSECSSAVKPEAAVSQEREKLIISRKISLILDIVNSMDLPDIEKYFSQQNKGKEKAATFWQDQVSKHIKLFDVPDQYQSILWKMAKKNFYTYTHIVASVLDQAKINKAPASTMSRLLVWKLTQK